MTGDTGFEKYLSTPTSKKVMREKLAGLLSRQREEMVAYLNEVDIEQNRELYGTDFAAGMEKMRKIITTYQSLLAKE